MTGRMHLSYNCEGIRHVRNKVYPEQTAFGSKRNDFFNFISYKTFAFTRSALFALNSNYILFTIDILYRDKSRSTENSFNSWNIVSLRATNFALKKSLFFIRDGIASKVESLCYVEVMQICIYICQSTW